MIDPFILVKLSQFNHKERLEQAARARLAASVYQAPSLRERISHLRRSLLAFIRHSESTPAIRDAKLITSEHHVARGA